MGLVASPTLDSETDKEFDATVSITEMSISARISVFLNIYDLPDPNSGFNNFLSQIGIGGLFHSGIEVVPPDVSRSFELSFSAQGINRTAPRLPDFGSLRTQIKIGEVDTLLEVHDIVNTLSMVEFRPGVYHLTERNCNHFTNSFSVLLFDKPNPDWLNRAATFASTALNGGIRPTNVTNRDQIQQNANTLPMFGAVSQPSLPAFSGEAEKNTVTKPTSIFSLFSSSTVSSSTTTAMETLKEVKKSDPKAKKELTEKQKELLAKIKTKK